MAKKKGSILGSILKGTIDISGEIIKTGYNAATSKTAKKFYKGTAELTKDAIKGTYDAVTSKTAKKIYKKTGETAVDLMRFTPPKEKLDNIKKKSLKEGLLHYLIKEEEHIKDTYNSLINNHLNSGYNEKQYLKFKTHWRAISTQMAFGALAKTSPDKYFEIRNYLEEELNKKDKKIMELVDIYYNPAYGEGGHEIPRILNCECFENQLSEEAIDEFNRGFALIHEFIIERIKLYD